MTKVKKTQTPKKEEAKKKTNGPKNVEFALGHRPRTPFA